MTISNIFLPSVRLTSLSPIGFYFYLILLNLVNDIARIMVGVGLVRFRRKNRHIQMHFLQSGGILYFLTYTIFLINFLVFFNLFYFSITESLSSHNRELAYTIQYGAFQIGEGLRTIALLFIFLNSVIIKKKLLIAFSFSYFFVLVYYFLF